MEEWKDIKGYEGLYQVSSLGRIFSVRSNRCLQPFGTGDKKPYLLVDLYQNGQRKRMLVHRLVAMAFIPNPDELPQINHLNEDPSDNRVMNLEWCDAKYNMNYGTRTERAAVSHFKPVEQYDLDNNYIRTWINAGEAARQIGISQGNISSCCSGRKGFKTAGGFIWKFAENSENFGQTQLD